MSHAFITHLTIPKFAILEGVSAVSAGDRARAGRYGPLQRVKGRGCLKISIAEAEARTGRFYTASQIEAAAAAPAQVRSPKQKAAAAAKREHEIETARSMEKLRETAWRKWITDGIYRAANPKGPPLIALIEDKRDELPKIYGTAEVAKILADALLERDQEWLHSGLSAAIDDLRARKPAMNAELKD
jgi:hypothetical protein